MTIVQRGCILDKRRRGWWGKGKSLAIHSN